MPCGFLLYLCLHSEPKACCAVLRLQAACSDKLEPRGRSVSAPCDYSGQSPLRMVKTPAACTCLPSLVSEKLLQLPARACRSSRRGRRRGRRGGRRRSCRLDTFALLLTPELERLLRLCQGVASSMEELFLELLRLVSLGGDAMIGLVDVSPQMNHLAASN